MKKIAVIFPGIGYHADKPLLYYSRMLARESGYEITEVPYRNFPPRIRGDRDKMKQALEIGLSQAEEILKHIQFIEYEKILFISKSIGTAIAVAYAANHKVRADHLWYTPLAETFEVMGEREGHGDIIAFHGTRDPWASTSRLQALSSDFGVPLYLTEGGNHSLETGQAEHDLKTLLGVMEKSRDFIC